jgi:hypothetical protein
MTSLTQKQKYKDTVDAARCNLELAQSLLADLPDGLDELEHARIMVSEALLACLRLSLEVGLTSQYPQNRPRPRLSLVLTQEKAS